VAIVAGWWRLLLATHSEVDLAGTSIDMAS
jgi:hypothetical protein